MKHGSTPMPDPAAMSWCWVLMLDERKDSSFGGGLSSFRPAELGAIVIREAIARAGIAASDVQNVVIGNVVPSQPKDVYISRMAAVNAGISIEAPAMNVNRLCGSGLQAIVSAAQGLALGEFDIAIGGGAESMSNAPHMLLTGRKGRKMGDLLDAMLGALHDPFGDYHMGVTAENVAEKVGISRAAQDEAAVESHRRAAAAVSGGYFKDQIVPIEIASRKGTVVFDTDEHVRADASMEAMAGLKPVFKKDGTVTAGNASGINDGAGAVVLAEAGRAAALRLKPLARLVGYAHAGVEPEYMGIGPVPATRLVLRRTGLRIEDLDVIESNEAFAAQACAVTRELGFDPAKVNPNGSGISLGHPVGATGAIITVKAIHELHRIGGRYALVTMCIGGGQGIAAVFERI